MEYCDQCPELSPTEAEQDLAMKAVSKNLFQAKPPHRCKLSGRMLPHRGEHPRIPRPHDCPKIEENDNEVP